MPLPKYVVCDSIKQGFIKKKTKKLADYQLAYD